MAQKIIVTILILLSVQSFSQDIKVLITEEKNGKRVVLFAENKTTDTLNVFLLVNAEGYRKSASKPVIKDIPPLSRIPMITLIELREEQLRYTFDLIVNEEKRDLTFYAEKQAKDITRIISGRLVIFSLPNCEKCDSLSNRLTEQRLTHKVFNIKEDAIIYRQFMALIERDLTQEIHIRFPVIWNKDHVIFGYDDIDEIIEIVSSTQ
jgi:glutaredoxin